MTLEKDMEGKLRRIFGLEKVSFDLASISKEQEGIHIAVERCVTRIKDKREIARVTGKIIVFASTKKMPMGFFQRQLDKADPADKQDFFFSDFEANVGQLVDIVERSASFVYFYNGQYDPSIGRIESINLTTSETL